jgi:hypothetical protein
MLFTFLEKRIATFPTMRVLTLFGMANTGVLNRLGTIRSILLQGI